VKANNYLKTDQSSMSMAVHNKETKQIIEREI